MPRPPPELDPEVAQDLARQVREALARFGAAGAVSTEGTALFLDGPNGPIFTDVASVGAEWPHLSLEDRRWHATRLARRLLELRRAVPATVRRRGPSPLAPLIALAGGALVALGAVFGYPLLRGHLLGPPSADSAEDATPARPRRAYEVCDAARARAARGATLTPADAEGWVVELVLLRPPSEVPFEHDPGLRAFLEQPEPGRPTRLVWAGAPELSSLPAGAASVVLTGAGLPATGQPRWQAITLGFGGRYVSEYLRPAGRAAFFAVADDASHRLGASFAGLFARCDGTVERSAGSWFRGPSHAAAAAALVYFMGTAGADLRVDPAQLAGEDGAPDPTRLLTELPALGRDLKRSGLGSLLAASGGMVSGQARGPITLTFPFEQSNRASLASGHVARYFGVARAAP